MKLVTRRIACFCENTFDAPIAESADLAAEPDVEGLILSGEFMSVHCTACGKRLTPEFPFHLSGVKGAGSIFLVPESDHVAFVRGKLSYTVGGAGRVAVGFPELAEKVRIFGQGLDDRVIEIMKFYLLTGSRGGGESTRDVSLSYQGEEEGRLVFHITGLRDGEIGVTRLAREFYRRVEADVEQRVGEEPFRDFCSPPWVSIRRVAGGAA